MPKIHSLRVCQALLFMMRIVLLLPLALVAFLPQGRPQTQPPALQLAGSWLRSLANPALGPTQDGLLIHLPAYASHTWFQGPAYGDFVARQGGRLVLTIDEAIARMDERNALFQESELLLLAATLRRGRMGMGLSSRFRLHARGHYPRTLPQLIWQGNSQFVGQFIRLDHDIDMYSFHELAAWGSWTAGRLTVAARLKWLNGVQALRTGRNELGMGTSEADYAIWFETDYELYSAGSFDYRSLRDFTIDWPEASLSALQLFTPHGGMALDLGLAWQSDTWEIGASATDIGGRIRWQEGARRYRSQGTYSYSGVDISAALTGQSVSLGNALDTLRALLQLEQMDAPFETNLPARYWLSVQRRFSDLWRAGLIWTHVAFDETPYTALSLQGALQLGPLLEGGLSLSLRKAPWPTTLGLSASAKVGGVRASAWLDNVAAVWAPARARFLAAGIGVQVALPR